MVGLKLYCTFEKLIEVVRVLSSYIGIKYVLDKCTVLILKKSEKGRYNAVVLLDCQMMGEIDENRYKYLEF